MSANNLLVELKGICFNLKNQWILKDVSLKVSRGEIITIIGPNGAGKTTLFRILLGLLQPNSGIVWRTPDLKIGYMPQKLHIDPSLPLNVRRFLSLRSSRSLKHIEDCLEKAGAISLIDRSLHVLSGGEMQRILLARAIMAEPDILILDEPVQGVDINGQEELYHLISQLRNRLNCGVLLVSHDLHLVLASSDHVICLNRHVCCAGQPEKIILHPEYVALFGEKAAEHLALYMHRHDHHHDTNHDEAPL